jgi:hypothetical protein
VIHKVSTRWLVGVLGITTFIGGYLLRHAGSHPSGGWKAAMLVDLAFLIAESALLGTLWVSRHRAHGFS